MEYDHYVNEVVKQYVKEIVGVSQRQLIQSARKFLREQKFWTYRYTRNLVEKLRKTHRLVGISGSPLEVVREFNKYLKFDKIYGTELGLDQNGKFTGKVLHVPGEYKKELLVRYVSSQRLSLRGSIGVGDTEGDIGILELVDHPIAFNPNTKLATAAKKNKWTVVIERKDLIVEFKPDKVKYLKV